MFRYKRVYQSKCTYSLPSFCHIYIRFIRKFESDDPVDVALILCVTIEKTNVNHVINQKSEDLLEEFNNIKASLDELKVTVNENIYHARQAPPIDPEMITKKLSLCSESIIKSAMPL